MIVFSDWLETGRNYTNKEYVWRISWGCWDAIRCGSARRIPVVRFLTLTSVRYFTSSIETVPTRIRIKHFILTKIHKSLPQWRQWHSLTGDCSFPMTLRHTKIKNRIHWLSSNYFPSCVLPQEATSPLPLSACQLLQSNSCKGVM